MSDSLFDADRHFGVYKPKSKGILHFSKMLEKKSDMVNLSAIEKKRNRRAQAMSNGLGVLSFKRTSVDERIQQEQEQYKSVKVPMLDKQFPRINPRTSDLPVYLQNIHGRLAINN